MVTHLYQSPTHVTQLVEEYPDFIGYSDACGIGAGGVWCSGQQQVNPMVWKYEWPSEIKSKLITDKNPNGSITINDLELAGIIINWLMLEYSGVDLRFSHISNYCDNTSAVAWAYKLRTSTSIPAGRLLRMLGLRIHARKSSGLTPISIKGEENIMADVASRAFKSGKYFTAFDNLLF